MANDLDAFVPELWAQESLMVLESQCVMSELIHRDFQNVIANYGDTVNTRRPGRFVGIRKTNADDVTIQDATATNVAVKLDQHLHTSFKIADGEEALGFQSLRDLYLVPALESISQSMDQILLYQMYEFLDNNAGRLGVDPDQYSILELSEQFDERKVPTNGRNLVITPGQKAAFLGLNLFTAADAVGDNGTALREGSLGRKYGFNTFMSQNAPRVSVGNTLVLGAINNASGYVAGDTALTVDGFSAAILNGTWCIIAGDDTPQMITGTTGGAIPTALAITPGLQRTVADNAVVTIYAPGAVNLAAGYAAGHAKNIVVDAFTVAPRQGQLVSFGVDGYKYGVRHETLSTPGLVGFSTNRNLDAAIVDDAVVGIGPAGNYGFAFHRNCMGLITRPLPLPRPGTGALAAVANYKGYSVRVTITYQGVSQGHLVTVDMLAGVKTFDGDMGTVLFS